MSLSNPYHWVSDLAPRARRRIVLSAGASMALVAGLTMAAVLVPAGAGNAAPPPDYAEVGGPCENTTFFQTYGAGADGSPASYFRYRFLSSYEINGSPSSRYWRYVHLEERWSGTEWVADPDRRTVHTWYCDTPAPVPSTSSPTPTPTPTGTPTPTPTPSPTPDGRDCGEGRLTNEDVQAFLGNWEVSDADRADIEADPCVLTRDWDARIPVDNFNWTLTGSSASGTLTCGTFQWTASMDLQWRGSGPGIDSPKVRVTQQSICWDRYSSVLTNGAGQPPALPTVEVVDAWRVLPLQITKTGVAGSGVSSCSVTGSVFGNRVEPAGGWVCALEANVTFAAGITIGFFSTGGPWTRTTPVLDFWRIPGAPGT